MFYNKKLKSFVILGILFSFIVSPSYGLTESVDTFGKISSVDLVLNDIWIEPENPRNGEAVTVKGSLYNAGIIPSGDVSDAVTVGYLVNGELLEITSLENILPGIENGVEISSKPLFDATSGNHIITVIINYHDTLSHLRDNPENNIVQKRFQIETSTPVLITSDIHQYFNGQTNKQQIKVYGVITDIFQDKLENKEISIKIKEDFQEKVFTDTDGRFSFETEIPFENNLVEINMHMEKESFFSSPQTVFPIKLNKGQSALALEVVHDRAENIFEEHELTAVIFQDSYDKLHKKISSSDHDKQNLNINDFLLATLPAEHEYIIEIYMEGRVLDAFQNHFPDNTVIKKEAFISESAQVQFKITNEDGEPQRGVIVENWIYSTNSGEEGFTEWVKVLPTFSKNEPYVAKATFPNEEVIWSEPFQIEEGERKIIHIIKGGN